MFTERVQGESWAYSASFFRRGQPPVFAKNPPGLLPKAERAFSILNMRSASMKSDAEDQGDLTARARVRDAAIDLFGRHGFNTSVRAIATEAGVSPGLILHHFTSKEGLRQACDEHVLRMIRGYKEMGIQPGSAEQMLMAMASLEQTAPLVGYALRSLQSGGDLAKSFIDHFVADAEEWIADGVAAGTILPSHDEKARARFVTVQGFGALMLDLALNPPEDPSDFSEIMRGYIDRMGLPTAELYTQGLMADRSMLDAYLMYVTDPPDTSRPPGSPGPPGPPGNQPS